MADRYPLIYNPSANQIQELQSGDSLDVGNGLVKNATGYATSTGTSSQFLKADGSSDSNTYLTSAGTIALAQGLTGSPNITVGAVSGTTGTFSGNVSAVNVSASSSVTAATFYGDGSQLTGIDASALKDGSNVKVQATATGATVTGDISATNAIFSGNLTVQGTTSTIDTIVTSVDSLTVDGSVGVGTTNPQASLHLFASDAKLIIQDSDGSGDAATPRIQFQDSTGSPAHGEIGYSETGDRDLSIVNKENASVKIATNNTERVRVTSSGDIGIGTDAPATNFKLDVNGDLSLGEFGGTDNTYIDQKQNGSLEIINSGRDTNSGDIRINRTNNISGDTTYFRDFRVYDGKGTTLLFVDGSAAGVGINSTAPTGTLDVGGNILPDADNTRDLGSASKRWANIYTGDLNLSNEGAVNDVDGTWGQYTIQEGENDLFLINRRTGKKYKFNLTEVN